MIAGTLRSLLLVGLTVLLLGCERSFEDMAEARLGYAEEGEGPIVVAVFDDPGRPDYIKGAQLALDKVNDTLGGLLGRPLILQSFTGSTDFTTLRPTIRRIAQDRRVSAVLGHHRSQVATPASIIYEAAEILFFPSFATDPMLTEHGFRYIFRTLPDNAAIAEESAHLASLFGYKRVAVLHARDDYSRENAFLFEDAVREQGIEVAFRGSFFADDMNYRGMLGRLSGVEVDAVYVSTNTVSGARLIRQMHEMGLRQPTIVSDMLAEGDLPSMLDDTEERVIAPMSYNPDSKHVRSDTFLKAWRSRHGTPPDDAAALGYDAMRLFAEIVLRAGSTEPEVLAASAHYGPPVVGVGGFYAYDEAGEIFGKTYGFRVLRGGRWQALPGVEVPYVLRRLGDALAAGQSYAPANAAGYGADEGNEVDEALLDEDDLPEAPELDEGMASTESGPEIEADTLELPGEEGGSIVDRNQFWLALTHAVLGYERLGVIALPTLHGSASASLARQVAASRGFELEICAVAAPSDETTEEERSTAIQRGALECYSALAPMVDVMFSPVDAGLSASEMRRLNRGLHAFQVPAVSIGNVLDADYGLTLAVVGSDLGLDDPSRAQRFDGLLNDVRIFDLSRRLADLPTIAVDFTALATLGRRLTPQQLSVVSRSLEPGSTAPAED